MSTLTAREIGTRILNNLVAKKLIGPKTAAVTIETKIDNWPLDGSGSDALRGKHFDDITIHGYVAHGKYSEARLLAMREFFSQEHEGYNLSFKLS